MEVVDVVVLATGIAGVVLGAAGATKVIDPGATARMLEAVGAPGGRLAARLLGTLEILIALWLLASGSRWAAAATALAYLVLTLTVALLRHRSPATPCGCFGAWSGPPSARHLAINLSGVAVSSVAATAGVIVGPPAGWTGAGVLAWWLVVVGGSALVVLALAGPRHTRAGGRWRESAPQDSTRITNTTTEAGR